DIMCLGKALTGGYLSFAATLSSEQVAQVIRDGEPGAFMHGPTFMANPLACSAAIASLDLLAETEWQQAIMTIEQQLKTELAPALQYENVVDVRTMGAIGVIEMRDRVDPTVAQGMCADLGVWLRPFNKNIYCMPPYIITSAQLSLVTTAMLRLAQLT
ncbi:aminotransferase class III-fold pyridoxal phosphate-dependent enzyme, partial [Arenicella sp.]|nr:aminotransferase class III-fold pyridoxal phosphate-dependent enzyme [Arenicella sp.]